MNLTAEADLAAAWGMPVEKVADLRQRKHWPHVKLSRSDIRYTDAQIAEIIATHTVKATPSKPERLVSAKGLTRRSASRAS